MTTFLRNWLRGSLGSTSRARVSFKPDLDLLEARAVPATITVTGTGDTIAVDGFVTLREAITAANTNTAVGDAPAGSAGLDTIKFNITGAPGTVHTIQVLSALPTITESLFIDGYSQLGASPNTATVGTNAILTIELEGSSAGFISGLSITAGNSTVQGLVINRFKNDGILITGNGGNKILGNFLGTDPTGKIDRGNGITGITVLSSNNIIGNGTLSGRNLISGNNFSGVAILNQGINGNLIQGNLIGTDDTGLAPLGNGGAGVSVFNVTNNTIGGVAPGAANVIAFNSGSGVEVADNAGPGNAILGNSIFGNGGLGIDLHDDGVTLNDPLDADAGGNGLQNFPVLASATAAGTGTIVTGTLHSKPNAALRIEFYVSPAADPSGFGQGQTFLGFVNVVTDAAGNASFTFNTGAIPVGQVVTATATDLLTRDTSEFSATREVALPVSPPPAAPGAPAPGTPAPGTPTPGGPAPIVTHLFAVGAGFGSSQVKVYNTDGSERFSFLAFDGFTGGVRVATGDVTGDGTDDIIVGAGPGAAGGHVKVFDGQTGALVRSFFAFDGFTGGVSVAAGDVNNDGFADIVVGAGPGAPGGHVKVFDGLTGGELHSFLAFEGFTGGVTVATGDLNADGFAEVLVGAGAGASGGHVKAFDGPTGAVVRSFFAFDGFTGGVNVAGGDLDADGRAEIVVGSASGPTHVKAFDGATGAEVRSFFALPPGSSNGVRVATHDFDADGAADFLIGASVGARAIGLSGTDFEPLGAFGALDPLLAGGVFVG